MKAGLMKGRFFGGVQLPEGKQLSLREGRLRRVVPGMVALSMRQHIGVPCEPLVEVGQPVLLGQMIGAGEGLCPPVHASVSGVVRAVKPMPHPGGGEALAVLVENDLRSQAMSFQAKLEPLEDIPRESILQAIADAGVVGLGGAAFPSAAKALAAMDGCETLIINACECEPYITADDVLLRTMPDQALEGVRIFKRLLQPSQTLLALEENKQPAIAALRSLLGSQRDIQLVILPTRYPQGSERQLIQALTRRQLPPGSLPAEAGCAVFNISTCAAACRALRSGMPLTERIVTLSGEALAAPQNLIAPIGTSLRELIAAAGGLLEEDVRVIVGGPMMGTSQTSLDTPLVKASSALLCLPERSCKPSQAGACLRCGRCVQVCPMRLEPLYLRSALGRQNLTAAQRLHLADCILCGCCTYVCPAGIALADLFRGGKAALRQLSKSREAQQ